MAKEVKLFKTGMFYNAYGDDAIILFELMNYKVSFKGSAGFPEKSLSKVLNKLESVKIGYSVFEKDAITFYFVGIDKIYNKTLKEGLKHLDLAKRLENLYNKIDKMNENELKIYGIIN